jgi:hypothetical protein
VATEAKPVAVYELPLSTLEEVVTSCLLSGNLLEEGRPITEGNSTSDEKALTQARRWPPR